MVTQNIEIVQLIIGLMNYKKNLRLKRLAYAIIGNLLCEEDLRRALMKHSNLDIIAKLIGILDSYNPSTLDMKPNTLSKKNKG